MIVAVAALAAAGCDRLTLSPPKASSEPTREAPAAPAVSSAALRAAEGSTYATFVSDAGARYAPETLGLAAVDRARLWRAMAAPEAARLLSGGGAEALVFRGCSEAAAGRVARSWRAIPPPVACSQPCVILAARMGWPPTTGS
jgi:hypothetical protein